MASAGVTILTPLRSHAEKHPDKLLYAFLGADGRTMESYTYGAFVQRSSDIAAHIDRIHPLEPGERVLLVYPPGIEMICAFFACVRLGLIPVPVSPPSSHGFAASLYRMNFIARDCRAAAVLTERAYYWSLKVHRTRRSIARLSFTRDHTSRLKWIVTNDAEEDTHGVVREAHSDVLLLQYTSGSTSDPKGVMVTHRNLLENCDMTMDHVPVGVSWLPQYHDMGLIGSYLFPALKGGTTYGFSPVDFIERPVLWLEAISTHRATISAAPNFAYDYCLRPEKVRDDELHEIDLGSLEVLMNGAEPVRSVVFRRFLERFRRYGLNPSAYVSAYGLAEFTLAVANRGRTARTFDASCMGKGKVQLAPRAAPASSTTTLVSCGRPLGDTRVRIVDISGIPREAGPGRIGEVWLSGSSKCRGYWDRPALSKAVFQAQTGNEEDGSTGWLRTGDLGFMLDGELFICGRVKDVIIVRGLNYYPQDIEAIVENDPAVRKGCVAAFAVERGGEEGLVVVAELRDASRVPDAVSLNGRICARLGIAADSFVYIPARTIPKTTSGKIMRRETRARWCDGALRVVAHVQTSFPSEGTPGVPARTETAVGDTLDDSPGASLQEIFGRYGLSGTEGITLGEAGLDSLAIVELASDLQGVLEGRGARELAGRVDVRGLQKIAISELFGLLRQVTASSPRAKLRFQQAFAALEREQSVAEQELMRRDAARPSLGASKPRPVKLSPTSTGGGILLTGGTGFFGPFLLQSLLEQTDHDIYVIVRAGNVSHAKERLRDGLGSLRVRMDAGPLERWENRVMPICGDLSQPNLGVSPERWAFLTEGIHTIYHNGAMVNYLADYVKMRDVNVGGTREVVRLAFSRRAKVLNHISSTFVFGWSTKATLFETDTNQNMDLLDFGYSQSKWVSEQIVFDAMRRGLPVRVFRPALITPSVAGGGHNFDIAIRLLAFMIKHRMSTTARNEVSFLPADLAGNNIVAISNLPGSIGKTFHVTRDDYARMSDITDILGNVLSREFVEYPVDDFVPLVIERCQKDDLLFPLLNFLVRSVDNITAMEFKRYCNRNYRQARDRSPFGREDPSLEDVVLGILRFMRRHGILEASTSVISPAAPGEGGHHVHT